MHDKEFKELLDKLDAAMRDVERMQKLVKKETGKRYVPGGRFFWNHEIKGG